MSSMITDLLGLSHVSRWTTHPVGRQQSVAEHSYRVAVLAMAIRDALSDDAANVISMQRLLRWALVHDGPETKTGDMPRPFKEFIGKQQVGVIEAQICEWYGRERTAPSALEFQIVHIADNIEALSWISRWGHGFRDKFDGHDIEERFRKAIWDDAGMMESELPSAKDAILKVLAEAVPH